MKAERVQWQKGGRGMGGRGQRQWQEGGRGMGGKGEGRGGAGGGRERLERGQ